MSITKTLSIILLLTLISGILQLLPVLDQELLYYRIDGIPAKLYYLWLTPHLIHLDGIHYLINILSLSVVLFTFRAVFTPLRFFLLFVFSSFIITLGLRYFSPDVLDYVGMSGVIYGILAAGLLWSVKEHPLLSWLVFFIIAGKVLYEQFYGPHLSIQTTLGEVVIVDAHFYGFLSGTLFALLFMVLLKKTD